jgi:serine/threonine-protein kinase RsbW
MAIQPGKKLMSALPAGEFFGRRRELDRLLRHAGEQGGLRLLSPPWGGASELLRQVFDRLFFDAGDVIPFYFALKTTDVSGENAARRFLQEFLLQLVAFRRRNPAVYLSAPESSELSKLVPTADANWADRLIDALAVDEDGDGRSFIRNCLSSPLRAAAAGNRVFVLLDDIHNAAQIDGGQYFLSELADVISRSAVPSIFSARRRFAIAGSFADRLVLDDLEGPAGGEFAVALAEMMHVAINDQTRDLIVAQTRGRVGFIRALVAAAGTARRPLDSFQQVEQVHTDAILKGALGAFCNEAIAAAAPEPHSRRDLIQLLFDGLAVSGAWTQTDLWQGRLNEDAGQFQKTLEMLDRAEIISRDGSLLRVAGENPVLADTIRTRYRIECAGEPRAVVAGEILAGALKRAPQMMARSYRRDASVGLARILSSFNCQEVPRAMLDYGAFRSEYKGLSPVEVDSKMAEETNRMALPQIVHAAPAGEYYRLLAAATESERAIVAIGFNDQNYAEDSQVTWLAAEIESKLEADRDLAEDWCGRLEQAAQENGFANHRIWLVAPEGFSDAALDVLADHNAIGSSRRQALLLRDLLTAGEVTVPQTDGVEYEMVIPVGDDTELIAAHALEEIARRHKFPPATINQLKTALVEACINAAEHGLAPDRKIHQRFVISEDSVTITISNRGIRLADKLAERDQTKAQPVITESPDTRRGWGLNLIRGLMDDVRVEPVDDGTRITMTKFLREDAHA